MQVKTIVLLCLLLALASCGGSGARREEPAIARTMVYTCGDYEFVVHVRGNLASLYLPHSEHQLERDRRASQLSYRGEGVKLTLKEQRASLQLDAYEYLNCSLDSRRVPWEEARRRGVDFRAVGQEPGWHLEIDHGSQTLFVYNYGNNRFLATTAEPRIDASVGDGALTVYELQHRGRILRAELRVEHCQDSMSGEVFDNSVRVLLDGREYRGCGMALDSQW